MIREGYPVARVGILGGGQLGRMVVYEALRLGIDTTVLDPSATAPCARIAGTFLRGNLDDESSIRRVAEESDVLTWEIEHVGVDILGRIRAEGVNVQPNPGVLRVIQDKLAQKTFLERHGLPVPRFVETANPPETALRQFGLPCVQKSRFGGYDGRGVSIVRTGDPGNELLTGSTMIEELVDIDTEIAVLVARSTNRETAVYPIVEMVFSGDENICTMVRTPAPLSDRLSNEALEIATAAVEALDATGVVAVEMFVTRHGGVLINEIAPRPHNSGHLTIEACPTSQFEQHLRAVLGLPLGDTSLIRPAAMVNILGAGEDRGSPIIAGYREVMRIPGASIHLYGKEEARPFRKMGHVTVTAESLDLATERAEMVQKTFSVRGG